MRNHLRNRSGFTLVEMLISIAILSILGLSLTFILRSGITAWRTGEARTTTNATAEAVLGSVADDFASIFTKAIQPPGTVVLEIPTVAELYQRAQLDGASLDAKTTDFYSNEWCRISAEESLTIDTNHPWRGIVSPQVTFHFRLRFATKKAAIWMAKSGDVTFEATALAPDEDYDENEVWSGTPVPDSGNLSALIADATVEPFTDKVLGTDHIIIRAVLHESDDLPRPRLMPGTDGPVLRFTAEPDLDEAGPIKFQLSAQPGGAQRITFIRNFGSAPENAGLQSTGSLGEVSYVTTFNYREGGEQSPTGRLWRAERLPIPEPVSNETTPSWARVSLFDDYALEQLETVAKTDAETSGKSYHFSRDVMQQGEYYPIADNVLYFGIQAWDDDLGWVQEWEPDDGIPAKVRVILVLLPQAGAEQVIARLAEPLPSASTTERIVLDSAKGFRPYSANSALERFVKIEDEWIYYDNVSRGKDLIFDTRTQAGGDETLEALLTDQERYNILRGEAINRNQRSLISGASSHPAGVDVIQGTTYVRTIVLPNPRRTTSE